MLIKLSLISEVDLLLSHLAQLAKSKFHLHSKEVNSRTLSKTQIWDNQPVHACKPQIKFCYFEVIWIESVKQLMRITILF